MALQTTKLYHYLEKVSEENAMVYDTRLRCCATNQKVAGLIQGGVIGIFH